MTPIKINPVVNSILVILIQSYLSLDDGSPINRVSDDVNVFI